MRLRRASPPASDPHASETVAAYSAIPYPGDAYLRTHPCHVAAVARLHGRALEPRERWRVLELACADGGNALAIAASLPGAEVTAIDIDAAAIARGAALAREAGVENITLRAADVAALDATELGRFDLVIAHGLVSWVPETVRRRVLALCRECLAPDGLAFVSFNTGSVRDALRARLLPALSGIGDAHARLARARELLAGDDLAAGDAGVARHIAVLRDLPDHLLAHDDLAPVNVALSLSQVRRESGLRVLADAGFRRLSDPDSHRQVLLAHGRAGDADPRRMDGLHAAAPLRWRDGGYDTPAGGRVSGRDPATAQALDALAGAWPRAVAVEALPAAARPALLQAAARSVVTLFSDPPAVTATPGPRPLATPLARAQARHDRRAVNQWHRTVTLDAPTAALLARLDGTHAVRPHDRALARLVAAALVVS